MDLMILFAILAYGIGAIGVLYLYNQLKTYVRIKEEFDRNKDFWSTQKDFEE